MAAKLTQAELARQSGVPQPTISRIEAGITRAIDFAVLERLAKTLGKHPSDLIGNDPGRPTPRRKRKGA
jgi:transcriptional regulator with XRE-family HTH domain